MLLVKPVKLWQLGKVDLVHWTIESYIIAGLKNPRNPTVYKLTLAEELNAVLDMELLLNRIDEVSLPIRLAPLPEIEPIKDTSPNVLFLKINLADVPIM